MRVNFQIAKTIVLKLGEVYRCLPVDFRNGFGPVFQGFHRVLSLSRAS
jgi:hypothetical protein